MWPDGPGPSGGQNDQRSRPSRSGNRSRSPRSFIQQLAFLLRPSSSRRSSDEDAAGSGPGPGATGGLLMAQPAIDLSGGNEDGDGAGPGGGEDGEGPAGEGTAGGGPTGGGEESVGEGPAGATTDAEDQPEAGL